MPSQTIQVVSAILYQREQFLMQLRENISGILYPGCWVFFGGHMELNETPEQAIHRELLEEIGYLPPKLTYFGCYSNSKIIGYVFHGLLTVEFNQLVLGEGWDMALLTLEQIRAGFAYSEKAGQMRPLGIPHHRILWDFLKTWE